MSNSRTEGESRDEAEDKSETNGILRGLSLYIGVVFLVIVLVWVISGYYIDLNNRLQLLGITSNLLLTIAIIGVYANIAKLEGIQSREAEKQTQFQNRQVDIQESVANIQRDQNELMEANHKPAVRVANLNVKSNSDGLNRLIVALKNEGNGLARKLSVSARLSAYTKYQNEHFFLPIDDYINGRLDSGPEGIQARWNALNRTLSVVSAENGEVLPASEEIEYETILRFDEKKLFGNKGLETVETHTFSSVLDRVDEDTKLKLEIVLYYEDILGEDDSLTIFRNKFNSGEAENLQEAMDLPNISMI